MELKSLRVFFANLIVIIIFLLVGLYLLSIVPHVDIFSFIHKKEIDNISRLYDGSALILTIFLLCCTWLQLKILNNVSKADFLLKLDNRYGSKEIIRARAVIQGLYRKHSPTDDVHEDDYIKKMADEIDDIRGSSKDDDCDKFAYLLNLLDFLETVGYFVNKDHISIKEVDELFSESLIFYYKIFKRWIYYRRSRYSENFYREFEDLVNKIKSRNAKEELAKTCFLLRFLKFFD
ncbi:MAG TPA: hypothetical protein VHA13_02880 [Gammaproteobacteria bacterium]|nr:hypothetical protein [Gammaproteobacteria bacterium]